MDAASKKHIARTALGKFGIVLGLLCLTTAAALAFGMQTVRVSSTAEAPNITAAGAACGFAIAGGLCLVATAISELRGRESSVPRDNDGNTGQ